MLLKNYRKFPIEWHTQKTPQFSGCHVHSTFSPDSEGLNTSQRPREGPRVKHECSVGVQKYFYCLIVWLVIDILPEFQAGTSDCTLK